MRILDAEVHTLPPEWCTDAYAPESTENIILPAMYEHPQRDKALAGAHEEGLLAEMERVGVDGAVIMGLPWKSAQRCERNNEYVAQVCARNSKKFKGLGILPPPESEVPEHAVLRLKETYGFTGIKVIPSWHGYRLDSSILEPALALMEKEGLVLMSHTDHLFLNPQDSDTAYSLLEVARRHPELKIFCPHLGGLLCLYALHAPIKPALKNLLFLGSVSATPQMISFAQQSIGADAVSFATDFPFNMENDMFSVVNDCKDLPMDTDTREKFFYGNLMRFLGWEI
ncbi:amidohydrolase family protein [Desulfovibrio sp. JC010]|uniref:amidohydrolase family protein n=1 Tax=Desulfovibrio sp. JC010 TaxID=2593641 RepID=UPI0013D39A1D|nr:amidohydrolase family protein [Desulfovibrio sp. JC010]NDV26706.1 amidohydrolase family protein [Desulfovibrio sp. JC010]